jgi:hypothetical protein
MATTSLIFSSPRGSTLLEPGRNKIATIDVGDFSSIRLYAFCRPQTPPVSLYLYNPELHDQVGTDPLAGALDKIILSAIQGYSAWYPLPGLKLTIEAFTIGSGGIDLYIYGQL